ncbi:MAG: ThuA domain-containing protein [Anaerolineae bacterium]|nr:ThuA domain-containing protein [Anaerolineae bacterium]
MKRALIVKGGWEGHEPHQVAEILRGALEAHGLAVTVSDTLDAFKDPNVKALDLIVPIWTMGAIAPDQLNPLLEAVRSGVGTAGVHGGMGDAFRNETEYQYMVGGQWVAHPGGDGVTYTVHIDGAPSPITEGIADFEVTSEQYYMHIDPAITVLATTRFGETVMPVVWTKHYGAGRVFYCSLGHSAAVVRMPPVLEMVTRGMLWAARADGAG